MSSTFNLYGKDDSSTMFKLKPVKRTAPEERTTLDLYHKYQFNSIKHKVQDISGLLMERAGIENLIENTNDEILVGQYEQRLELVEKEIYKLNKEQPIYDYFLKTGGILFDYYDLQERIASGEIIDAPKCNKAKPGNILSVLTEAAIKDGTMEAEVPSAKTHATQGREELLEQYLQIVDPNYMKKAQSEIDETTGDCKNCGEEMIFSSNEAVYNCPECGSQEFILMDSDRPS